MQEHILVTILAEFASASRVLTSFVVHNNAMMHTKRIELKKGKITGLNVQRAAVLFFQSEKHNIVVESFAAQFVNKWFYLLISVLCRNKILNLLVF